jgi:hypothetical protein
MTPREKERAIIKYIDRELEDSAAGKVYASSRVIGMDLGLNAKEVGQAIWRLETEQTPLADDMGFEVEIWGGSAKTVWLFHRRD